MARRHGEIGWLPGTAVALVIGPVSLVNYWILVTVLLLLVEGERRGWPPTPQSDATSALCAGNLRAVASRARAFAISE